MRVKKIKHIMNVNMHQFSVSKNGLAYNVNTQLFIADLFGNIKHEFTVEKRPPRAPYIYDDGFCFLNIFNSRTLALINNQFHIFDFSIASKVRFDKEDAILVTMFKNRTEKYVAKVTLKEKVLWTLDIRGFVMSDAYENFLFYTDTKRVKEGEEHVLDEHNKILVTVDTQTGEELWRYSLPETFDYVSFNEKQNAQIKKIVGVYNNIVWLALNSGALVGLQVETGELVKHVANLDYIDDVFCEEPSEAFGEENSALFHSSVVLDHEKGIIFTCISDVYAEVDLNQKDYPYSVWNLSSELAKQPSFSEDNDFSMRGIAGWEGDTVYIYDNSWSHCFGAFDRKTRTILWGQVFDGAETGRGAILNAQYSNGHFYIHARADNALHIYQLSES